MVFQARYIYIYIGSVQISQGGKREKGKKKWKGMEQKGKKQRKGMKGRERKKAKKEKEWNRVVHTVGKEESI